MPTAGGTACADGGACQHVRVSEGENQDAAPLRVLLVDDDALARGGLAGILRAAGGIAVVAEADDGDEVVGLVHKHAPDVVLMDVRMRRMDGIRATAAVTALARAPKVLMLTTFDLDEYVFDSLQAGARGFLLKDASPTEIAEGVRVVAAGESMLAPRATSELISHYVTRRNDPRQQQARQALARLSEREREIVAAVAQGKSNATIADEFFLAEATVKTHIYRAFAKADVENRVQLAIFAYAAGLVSR